MATRSLLRSRPAGIWIVAVLMAMNGLGAFFAAYAGLTGEAADRTPAYDALFGVAVLVLSWGLFMLRRWAWSITLTLQAVSLVTSLAAMQTREARPVAMLDAVLSLIMIVLLVGPRARAAFGPPLPPPTQG